MEFIWKPSNDELNPSEWKCEVDGLTFYVAEREKNRWEYIVRDRRGNYDTCGYSHKYDTREEAMIEAEKVSISTYFLGGLSLKESLEPKIKKIRGEERRKKMLERVNNDDLPNNYQIVRNEKFRIVRLDSNSNYVMYDEMFDSIEMAAGYIKEKLVLKEEE